MSLQVELSSPNAGPSSARPVRLQNQNELDAGACDARDPKGIAIEDAGAHFKRPAPSLHIRAVSLSFVTSRFPKV